MTCTGTYENGARTGLATTPVESLSTRRGRQRAQAASFAAVPGWTGTTRGWALGAADPRTAAAATRSAGTATSGSALSWPQVSEWRDGRSGPEQAGQAHPSPPPPRRAPPAVRERASKAPASFPCLHSFASIPLPLAGPLRRAAPLRVSRFVCRPRILPRVWQRNGGKGMIGLRMSLGPGRAYSATKTSAGLRKANSALAFTASACGLCNDRVTGS
jgi:hypothetical protein